MAHLKGAEVMSEAETGIRSDNPEVQSVWDKVGQQYHFSEIEFRILNGAVESDEQTAALFKELLTKEDEESILDILEKMRQHLHLENDDETEEDSAESSDSYSQVDQQKNPLLNDLVIECLFGFLSLNDILQCRLVNQKWNIEAESILHKRRIKIYLNSAERSPSMFLSNSFLAVLQNPFNDLTFLPCPNNEGKWSLAEMNNFFYNYGDYVEKLKFKNIVLDTPICQSERHGMYQLAYKITYWISMTPNLSHLDINCEEGTRLIVNHSHLTDIKFLSLLYCFLDPGLDWENNTRKIRPSVLRLENVVFNLKDSPLSLTRLNHFFDLDTATHINLSNNRMNFRTGVIIACLILNSSAHVFNTDMFICGGVILQNWEQAEGIINYLHLKDIPLNRKTRLQIKQICARIPVIDLSALPITVEKINLPLSELITRSEDEVELPNLTSVHFQVNEQSHDPDALNQFAHFPSLVDLKFVVHKMPWIVDMSMIPTSVKRVKIVTSEYFDFQEDWDMCRQLESLILENFARRLNEVAEILEKVKTKVLVISWNGEETLNTNEIVEFVLRENQRVEKIIIGTIGDAIDLHKCNTPFEQSRFSVFVDQKKANHYLFENEKGTPLTLEEFEKWNKMNDVFDDFE